MLLNVEFHMLSDGAAFTTQSHSSLRSYANNFIIAARFHNINDIVCDLFFCVACQGTTALCSKCCSI